MLPLLFKAAVITAALFESVSSASRRLLMFSIGDRVKFHVHNPNNNVGHRQLEGITGTIRRVVNYRQSPQLGTCYQVDWDDQRYQGDTVYKQESLKADDSPPPLPRQDTAPQLKEENKNANQDAKQDAPSSQTNQRTRGWFGW